MSIDPEVLERLRRNSGLELTADGTWRFHDQLVPNPRVQELFHRGVTVRDDGEVTLTVGRLWCYVKCATVARFVDGLRIDGDALVLRMRDGTELAAPRARLAVGPDERFYVWSDAAATPATFARSAHQQLAGMLEVEGSDELRLRVGDRWIAVRTLPEVPGPAQPSPG